MFYCNLNIIETKQVLYIVVPIIIKDLVNFTTAREHHLLISFRLSFIHPYAEYLFHPGISPLPLSNFEEPFDTVFML